MRRSTLATSFDTILRARHGRAADWAIALGAGLIACFAGYALGTEQWRTVVLVAAILVLPILMKWPVVSTVGVYVLLIPFESVSALSGGASLNKFVGLLAAATLLASGLVERRLRRPPFEAVAWIALILWAALTAMWAIDLKTALGRLPTALSLLAFYLVAISFRVTRRELTSVCALYVTGGAFAGAVTYFTGSAGQTPTARGTLAIAGQAANPNSFANSLLLPLALAFTAFLISKRLLTRALALAALGVIGLGIYDTMSRAALTGVIILLLMVLYRFGLGWRVVVAAALLAVLVLLMPETFFERVTGVFTGEDSTGAGRTKIWQTGLAFLDRYLFIGSGLSTFPVVYGRAAIVEKASHNTYLGAVIELGIVGLILLFAAIAVTFAAAQRRVASHRSGGAIFWAVQAACAGLLVSAFFGDVLWTKDFWMLWIMLAWASQVGKEETSPSQARVDRNTARDARYTLAVPPHQGQWPASP